MGRSGGNRRRKADDDDVQDEDGGDGECTGLPRSIRSSGWTKWTVAVLLGVFSRCGEHGGRGHGDGSIGFTRGEERERGKGGSGGLGFVHGQRGIRWHSYPRGGDGGCSARGHLSNGRVLFVQHALVNRDRRRCWGGLGLCCAHWA